MIALMNVIETLSAQRPVFHSEADFQHALAWQIRCTHPDAKVHLEKPCTCFKEKHAHVGIVAEVGGHIIGCEVKYYTTCLSTSYEDFQLKNQGAQDCGRYDFLWDLCRIERMVDAEYAATGYVVLLTNDALYWREPVRTRTIDADLRIHHGATVRGTLFWGEKASGEKPSLGSMRGRDQEIELSREYTCRWDKYSCLGAGGGHTFKYLLLAVRR